MSNPNNIGICRLLLLTFLSIGGRQMAQPLAWQPVITGQDHTLLITQSSQLMLDGKSLPLGSWIGAFYTNASGHKQCAGMVEWQGQNTVLPIYGANNTNPPLGFAANETFSFQVWLPTLGCVVDSITVSYLNGGIYTHGDKFVTNGLSGLANLTVSSGLMLDLGSDTTICEGESLLLDAGCCGVSYAWSNGSNSPVISVDSSGIYGVVVSSSKGCIGNDSILVSVELLPVANGIITIQTDTVFFLLHEDNYPNYYWDFGDGTTSSDTSGWHVYTLPGRYVAKLVVENLCGKDSLTQEIVIQTVGLDFSTGDDSLRVYPNPVSQTLSLDISSNLLSRVRLYAMDGSLMKELVFSPGFSMDVSTYPEGLFLLKIETQDGLFISKIILIQR